MIIQAISVLTILFIGLIPAYADSPLAQYNSGVPISNIQCSGEKILLQSTSGKPYCMSESTAAKLADRGFSLVVFEEIPQVELSETVWSSKDFPTIEYSSRHGNGSSSSYPHHPEIPPIILEIPHQVRIGEEFIVHVEYTITSDHLDLLPGFTGARLFADYPKQIELVSTEYMLVDVARTGNDWYGQYNKYTTMEFPYNELGLNEVDIVFKIIEPLLYEDHIFRINAIQGEIVGNGDMYASSTDDVLTLSPHRPVNGYDEIKYPNRYEEPRSFGWIPPWTPGVGPVYSDFNSLSLEDKSYIESWFKNRYNMTAPQSNDDNWTPEIQAEYEAWLKSTNQTR